ncbi:PepSY domain-containing protein [Loktanella sp. Alg231-35]|uniref:PepSY domain-containing protein n=1 Tax=Loktanella sp. Alg231-35 TaxID=1922220 RepID=UPI000D54CE12|nr:PepSY domain-containing protein [Loktanella sp. Alg231-35]
MKTKLIAGGALTGLVLAGGIAGMVSAQTVADATGLTEEQVIEIALMEVPGEVTDVEMERDDGQQVFEVEILGADGSEMEVYIAAETGEILEVAAEGDDNDCGGDHDDDDAEDA